jgi:Flp pilus assembly protein TadD
VGAVDIAILVGKRVLMATPVRVMIALGASAAAFLVVVALGTKSGLRVDPAAEVFSGSSIEGSRLLRRAFVYAREGMWEEAMATFQRAKELAPEEPLPYARLAQMHAEQDSFETALRELDAARSAGIAHVELDMARGLVYQKMGEVDEAERALEEACEKFPGEAGPRRSLGWLLLKQERPQDAVPYLEDAVHIAPDVAYHHRLLARAYTAVGRDEEAEREMMEATRLEPNDAGALTETGWKCVREGRPLQAVQYFREAIERQPDACHPRSALALTYERLGRAAEALEQWEQAARGCPEEPTVHRALGQAYERRGMYKQAARSYRWALDLGGPDPGIAAHLVSALTAFGDTAEACSVVTVFHDEFPDDELLAELLARLSVAR